LLPALTICLRDALNLILLLDRVSVRGFFRNLHDLIGEALRDGRAVAERTVAGTCADEVNRLVHAARWRHIGGLTSHDACRTDTRGVIVGAAILYCINVNLNGVLAGQEVDDFEGMLNDAHSHHFLAVVAAVPHHT